MEVQADYRLVQKGSTKRAEGDADLLLVNELQVIAEGTHRISPLSLITLHALKNEEKTR